MKTILRKIATILTRGEKRRLRVLLLVDTLVSIADIASLGFLLYTIHYYAAGEKAGSSPVVISLFLLFFLAKSLAGYHILRARYRFVYGVASRIAETNLLKYLEGDFSDYVQTDSAVHARRISQQPVEFCHHVLAGLQQAVTETALILVAVCGILWYDAALFLLLAAFLSPGLLLLSFVTRKRLRKARASVKNSSELAGQYLQETLTGYVESNIYERNEFFTRRYAGYQQDLNGHLAELQITQGMPARLIELFAVAGLFMLIVIPKWFPGLSNPAGYLTLGAFMAAAYKIIPGIVRLSNIVGLVRTYAFTLDGLAPGPANGRRQAEKAVTGELQELAFRKVSFSRNGQDLLLGLSLSLRSGDFAGISGLSGRGKTTIVNLLLGFLEPSAGSIWINGSPSGPLARKAYWKRISYVKQQAFLLHDSILTNITLDDGDYDALRLKEAVAVSGLEGLIGKFPEGLQRIVSEQGRNISGGQRQRIAIARALYKDSDLIILDEPFNELDQASEQELLECLSALCAKGKIILLITHRQKSFSFCNRLISLNEQELFI